MTIERILLDPAAEPNPADLAALDEIAATKLGGIDEGAKDDQTGAEIKTAYEGEDGAFNPTKDDKLTGIEENAKDDQSGAEIRDAVVALPDLERKIIVTNPQSGEFKVTAVQVTSNNKLAADHDDVPEG